MQPQPLQQQRKQLHVEIFSITPCPCKLPRHLLGIERQNRF